MSYLSRGKPPYIPLVNRHMRFYFSDPERQEFRSNAERRQHEAVKTALDALAPPDREHIRQIMTDGRPINIAIRELAAGDRTVESTLFKRLARVSRMIAERLFYITEGAWNR